MITYSDESKKIAIDQIGDYTNNYGGTDIYGPTQNAYETKVG